MYWYRKVRVRRCSVTKHYLAHKSLARSVIQARLDYWNMHYQYSYNRVALRNQKTCWGSCTEKGNLNFNYKLIFLPEHLMDYIVVHELCHLKELNHSKRFWNLVAQTLPDYVARKKELQVIERGGSSITHLLKIRKQSNIETLSTVVSASLLDNTVM